MSDKETYKKLCETEGSTIPLFLQYWWMETVCKGKEWDVALVKKPDGTIAAAMPYLWGKRYGMHYLLQPQLTQYSGPWFRPGTDTSSTTRWLVDYFGHLRPLFFAQNFAPGTETLMWIGYTTSDRITYRIEDISDPQQVFDGFDKQRRQRPIRRAAKVLQPVDDLSPQTFARFHADYWASRGQRDLLSQDFIIRVIETALGHGQGILLGLNDGDGKLHAARFVAYDDRCAYSLLSALNPSGHHNGASPLLFWHIIQRLSTRTRAFDFEGSMDPSIAFSYSLYGAKPITYSRVTRFRHPLVQKLLQNKI